MIVVKREVPVVDIRPAHQDSDSPRVTGAILEIHRSPSPGYTAATMWVSLSPVECRAVAEALVNFADEAERSA